jgi:hypothetical protein
VAGRARRAPGPSADRPSDLLSLVRAAPGSPLASSVQGVNPGVGP